MSSGHVINNPSDPILHRPIEHKNVLLDDGCDIEAGSIILMGAKIGKEAQIGTGAEVLNNIPDGKTAVGLPEKFSKSRSSICGNLFYLTGPLTLRISSLSLTGWILKASQSTLTTMNTSDFPAWPKSYNSVCNRLPSVKILTHCSDIHTFDLST
jgi:hypothetical protein